MNEVYQEYVKEHPEELEQLNRLKRYSDRVEKRLAKRRETKLKKIEECRRLLDGDNSI